jgi:hypothetical protein
MPRYPVYPSQPFTGNLPSLFNMGPPDLYPSSSTAPHYQRRLDSMYGRHLAGAEKGMGDDAEPAYALNELRLMTEMDDAQGNGVFDPNGTRPNIYPDAGIMASSYSIPGYLARERVWSKSEVVDGNTGRPVVYVPSGAVSMDSAAQIAFIEGGMYRAPRPYLDQYSESHMEGRSTVNVAQNPIPIGPDEIVKEAPSTGPSPVGKLMIALAIAGAGAGVAFALTRTKSHTPNRRRRRR